MRPFGPYLLLFLISTLLNKVTKTEAQGYRIGISSTLMTLILIQSFIVVAIFFNSFVVIKSKLKEVFSSSYTRFYAMPSRILHVQLILIRKFTNDTMAKTKQQMTTCTICRQFIRANMNTWPEAVDSKDLHP